MEGLTAARGVTAILMSLKRGKPHLSSLTCAKANHDPGLSFGDGDASAGGQEQRRPARSRLS